jgi:hypothetical protein
MRRLLEEVEEDVFENLFLLLVIFWLINLVELAGLDIVLLAD